MSTKSNSPGEAPLEQRVDDHFRKVNLALLDINGMMRHILDSLGALKVRLSEETFSPNLISVFGCAVKTIIDHITGFDLIDQESAIKLLIDAFPDDTKRKDGRGWLPLHWAAALNSTEPESMKALIVEFPFEAQKGHMHSERKILVDSNTDDQNPPHKGLMPLHFACSLRYPIVSNIKRIAKAFPSALMMPDHRGWLPTHWCAYNCSNKEVLEFLYGYDEDSIYQASKKNKLPFQLSGYNRSIEIMEFLYNLNKESIDSVDYNGNTTLHDAAKSFNAEGVKNLLSWRPELGRIRNFKEQLPIHKAFCFIPKDSNRLHFRHLETVKNLLSVHPETAALPDRNDALPLHLAVQFDSSYEVIEAVYNVYPSAALVKDNSGRLPVHYVTDLEVKRLLLKASEPLTKAGLTASFSRFIT